MKKIIAGLALSMTLSLTACGLGPVTEGTITAKNYEPEHVEQQEITEQECEKESYYTGTGKKRVKKYRTECEEVGTGEFEDVTIPDEWSFDLENKDGKTGTVEVDENTYNDYEVGDYYKEQ